MIAAVLSGFALALAAPWLHRVAGARTGWLVACLPAAIAVWVGGHLGAIAAGAPLAVGTPWVPGLGVQLSFYLDGLSALFALLIAGTGALVAIYAGGYLAGHAELGRFYATLLLFMASMLGLVLADNVLALFVFWELTSLASYLLIGFDHDREAARAAALQALLVTGAGGLALLAGLLLLGEAAGTLELSALAGRGEIVRGHALYAPAVILVLLGCFTKSAQVPFHFWLPSAMEAPTPVSAYLHAATMVKAGVYLIARLGPALGGTDLWQGPLVAAGGATMVLGAAMALRESDLKRILAYSTVAVLGQLVLLLGIGTTAATAAAMVVLLAHGFYKGALFLVAGALDHATGAREVERLAGLRAAMPLTAAVAALAALSMAGVPPLFGFIGKELLYEGAAGAAAAPLVMVAAVAASMGLVAVAGVVGVRPFVGARAVTPRTPHEVPAALWLGPVVLAAAGLAAGLAPDTVGRMLVAPAVAAVAGAPVRVELALWHGWSPALALSLLTFAGGAGLYAASGVLRRRARRRPAPCWGPARAYAQSLRGLNTLARAQTRLFQSGYLRFYLLAIVATTVGLAGYTLVVRAGLEVTEGGLDVRLHEALLVALMLGATLAVVRSRSRLGAVAALGVVGYAVALLYVTFGAPDLAVTQFIVETLTVILFVLVFYHLPGFTVFSGTMGRVRDAVIALAAGALMTALVLVAHAVRSPSSLAGYYAEHSVAGAHGRNIVNVILVDFRGLDTLGEITVLALAAVGAYALLRLRPGHGGTP